LADLSADEEKVETRAFELRLVVVVTPGAIWLADMHFCVSGIQ
jgi:hypothetical protein